MSSSMSPTPTSYMNIAVKFNYLYNERLKESVSISKSGLKQRLFDYFQAN